MASQKQIWKRELPCSNVGQEDTLMQPGLDKTQVFKITSPVGTLPISAPKYLNDIT